MCISSKSPCVNAISHQITANANHERKKLNANTKSVQRHCESTKVVKISCRKRILRWAILFWITLHSPFFKTALLRIFLELPGRYPRLLGKLIYYFPNMKDGLVVWMEINLKKKTQVTDRPIPIDVHRQLSNVVFLWRISLWFCVNIVGCTDYFTTLFCL